VKNLKQENLELKKKLEKIDSERLRLSKLELHLMTQLRGAIDSIIHRDLATIRLQRNLKDIIDSLPSLNQKSLVKMKKAEIADLLMSLVKALQVITNESIITDEIPAVEEDQI